ncbi:MAG: DUF3501 family protein [Byssovorax sp.]
MRPIERSEILPLGDYEMIRQRFRSRVIEEKRPRRVALGEHISAVFENRDSVLLQIQEMLRTERITSEPAILHEITTYNELVPGDREVSVTVFVEISDKDTRDRLLVELAGLEDTFSLVVDDARFPLRGPKPDGYVEGRTTAVHYLKAKLSAEAVTAITQGKARAALAVDHPGYTKHAELGRATLQKLAEDLGAPS